MTSPTPAADGSAAARIALLGRKGCHLCGVARQELAVVRERTGLDWVEIDVDTDPELRSEYSDQVPVVMVDGIVVAAQIVEADAVIAAVNTSS